MGHSPLLTIDKNEGANAGWILGHPYPGRMILAGRLPNGHAFLGTAITGRSEGTQNRRYICNDNAGIVSTEVADPNKKSGDPERTIYDTQLENPGIGLYACSNGRQTSECCLPGDLREHLMSWSYEPDSENTPRISAQCTKKPGGRFAFQLAIHRRNENAGCDLLVTEPTALNAGQALFLCTYEGPGNPLPSYSNGARLIKLGADPINEFVNGGLACRELLVCVSGKVIPYHCDSSIILWNRFTKVAAAKV